MSARSASLVVAAVVLGSVALGISAWAADPATKSAKRARKPTTVNIVESVPLEVTVTNAPLGVVAELPPVDVATLPAVTISALPTATHVGQSASDHVVLNLVNPTTSPIFVRCNDDGTRESAEFAVAAGSKFVVTDVDWVVTANQLAQYATLRLFVENKATPSNRCLAFLQTGLTTNVVSGGGSSAPNFGTTGMLSGFIVGTGARVVADVRVPEEAVSSGTALSAFTSTNATVVIRGYLVKAP